MRKVFLITYDLKNPGQDYSALYDAIKSIGVWNHPLESTWAVKTSFNITAESLYENIRPKIDDNDSLFIVDITNQQRQGWLPKTFWQWLNN